MGGPASANAITAARPHANVDEQMQATAPENRRAPSVRCPMMGTGDLDNDDSATSAAYAGMKVDDAKRHKDLEREYRQLAAQLDHSAVRRAASPSRSGNGSANEARRPGIFRTVTRPDCLSSHLRPRSCGLVAAPPGSARGRCTVAALEMFAGPRPGPALARSSAPAPASSRAAPARAGAARVQAHQAVTVERQEPRSWPQCPAGASPLAFA